MTTDRAQTRSAPADEDRPTGFPPPDLGLTGVPLLTSTVAAWPWIDLAVTVLVLASTGLTIATGAAGSEAARPVVLPEALLSLSVLIAWLLRVAGRPKPASLVIASSLLVGAVAMAGIVADDLSLVLMPVIAFVMVLPHLRGWRLGAFAALALASGGAAVAIQIGGFHPDEPAETPILTIGTLAIVALTLAAAWAGHRRAEFIGAEYAELVAGLPIGIARVTADGRLLAANPMFDQMFPGALRLAVADALAERLTAPGFGPDQGPGVLEVDDAGRRRTVRFRARRVEHGRGRPVFDGALVDNTTEREAWDQMTRLAAIVDTTDDPVVALAPDGTIQWCNSSAARLLQADPESLRGVPIQDVPLVTAPDMAMFLQAVREQRAVTADLTRTSRAGIEQTFSVRITPIKDDAGTLVTIAITAADVTELRRLARREGELEAQIISGLKLEALSRVMSSAAVDVALLAATVERLGLDEGQHSATSRDDAMRQAGRAAEAARSLSAYARDGSATGGSAVVDDVVSSTEKVLRQLVPRRILLEVRLDAPVAVGVTALELEEILATLVVNAVDAIGGRGRIRIATSIASLPRSGRPAAVIEVSDSGPGMTREVMGRVFEPFFTTKPAGFGTGLGLSSVQRLVADAGGSIDIESVPGEGTTFLVYLPSGPRAVRGSSGKSGLTAPR